MIERNFFYSASRSECEEWLTDRGLALKYDGTPAIYENATYKGYVRWSVLGRAWEARIGLLNEEWK